MSDVLGQDGQARSSTTKHGGMRDDILDVYSVAKNSELSGPSFSTQSANFGADGADDNEEDLVSVVHMFDSRLTLENGKVKLRRAGILQLAQTPNVMKFPFQPADWLLE